MDFKNVDKKYRPIPFWSWNEALNTEETRAQVALMDEAGIGGYFMHARGGLVTEYMGEEWFDNVRAATDEGAKRGMHSWAYDENGWPSGFGGGKVNGLGVEYQAKSLHAEPLNDGNRGMDNTLLERDGVRYYYTVNEFYVDVLDEKVIKEFIDVIYAEYERRCGHSIDGFFTDEPQIYRGSGFPWSFTLEDKFRNAYGYSLTDNLDSLFRKTERSDRVRLDFWLLVTELFSSSFFKQIYDWCTERGYQFTGHLVLEEDLFSQLVANGACMPHYEYFSMPGMDWLARPVYDCLTPIQVSSVAAQTGKKQILSETFALAGHNVSHAELKRIFEWQLVHGITTLCTHLEGYSLRGIRKRDYPPAMYYQQPWWEDMDIFFDAMSRVGMLLSEGEIVADTLVIHPESAAWLMYDGRELDRECVESIRSLSREFVSELRGLEDKHVLYHLGDEIIMKRHASVEAGRLRIGKMEYKTVVIPRACRLLPFTEQLIDEFRRQGGRVAAFDEIEENPVTAKSRLSYTMRRFPDFDLHYFVNTDNEYVDADISVGNKAMKIESGELYDFYGHHTFAPYESLVIIDDGGERKPMPEAKKLRQLSLEGEWQVKSATYNSLTLDRCDYYFDGELIERDGYVLNILPRLNELRRPVKLKQVYRFTCDVLPEEMYLATETPDIFTVTLNGREVPVTDSGYFRDKSIRLIEIASFATVGENTLVLESTVCQSDACYKHLDSSWTFEAMKNCLSYDMEIEPVYIVGGFGLKLVGELTECDRDAYRVTETPHITDMPRTVDVAGLDYSGFAEMAGKLRLSRVYHLDSTDYRINPELHGFNSLRMWVNGTAVDTVLYAPHERDISNLLREGENIIEIELLGNLRNMMGPHHLEEGESYAVCPSHFYKESNIFNHPEGKGESCHDTLDTWHDGICLVHFGLRDKK